MQLENVKHHIDVDGETPWLLCRGFRAAVELRLNGRRMSNVPAATYDIKDVAFASDMIIVHLFNGRAFYFGYAVVHQSNFNAKSNYFCMDSYLIQRDLDQNRMQWKCWKTSKLRLSDTFAAHNHWHTT